MASKSKGVSIMFNPRSTYDSFILLTNFSNRLALFTPVAPIHTSSAAFAEICISSVFCTGVSVGQRFLSREELNWAGVHRPMIHGISGRKGIGVYSVVLSGGYEDDVDYGECFTFTGHGGRELKGTEENPKVLLAVLLSLVSPFR